jgi:4-amino-4-deoxy-L-arabinose transferase-like glycosyltransferase
MHGSPNSTGEAVVAIEQETPENGRWAVRYRVLLLVLLGVLLYLPSLGLRDMWYPDEPDIAEVAQAMYRSGDWIAPRRMGVIWVDYPPMLYWAGAASAHVLGGVSEFAFRLPNALAAIALVLIVCVVGSRQLGARAGLWAGFMLLTFQLFVFQAVSYRPDVLFALFIAAGIFVYAAGAGDRPRWELRVAGFALLGLAMLSKGPLGLLLPGLVLTLWHGSRREWRRLLELGPLSLVALAVYLPWFAACGRAMGSDNILYELYAQNVARFFAGARGHEQPLYYYLENIWPDLYPWSLLLPFAIWGLWRARPIRDRHTQLLLWWFAAFFVFLSFAVTKRQLYLLPAHPAAALILASWVSPIASPHVRSQRHVRSSRWVVTCSWLLVAILVLLGLAAVGSIVGFETVIARWQPTPPELETALAARVPLAALSAALLASAAWIASAGRRRDARACLVRIGASHVVIYLLALTWLMPAFNPAKTYRPAALWIRDAIGAETHLGLAHPEADLGFRKMGAFGFYSGRLVSLVESEPAIERFFAEHPGSVVLVHESAVDDVFGGDLGIWRSRVVRDLWAGGRRYLVLRGS